GGTRQARFSVTTDFTSPFNRSLRIPPRTTTPERPAPRAHERTRRATLPRMHRSAPHPVTRSRHESDGQPRRHQRLVSSPQGIATDNTDRTRGHRDTREMLV